ncbi:MAG TPA: hypothetical protein VGL93_02585 [Streptosporangiaceae bacterium]
MINSVAGSASRASSAASVDNPPTSADRSRPPTPSTCDTPTPASSSRHVTCCAPVPDAATTPTRPGRVTFAKPSATPATIAVPQSGPMTSRPRRAAARFSATSWCGGTLSLNTITSMPASIASIASANAYSPGTETSAIVGARPWSAPRRTAAATVRGGGSVRDPPCRTAWGASASASRPRASSSPPAPPRTAITRSPGPAAGTANPIRAISSRFSSVPIATIARSTPATSPKARLTRIRVTESWYAPPRTSTQSPTGAPLMPRPAHCGRRP